MAKSADTSAFPEVFAELRAIVAKHAKGLNVTKDDGEWYYAESHKAGPNGKPMMFAAVRLGKRYVSIYLMAMYEFPEALPELSPELAKRRQGKSCFNFTTVDPKLFKELAAITTDGFKAFKGAGYA